MIKRARRTKSEFPITITRGSVRVKIYRILNRGRAMFTVAYRGANGKRMRSTLSVLSAAKSEAERIATRIMNGESAALELSNTDRSIYVRATELLRPTGRQLDMAVAEMIEAVDVLRDKGTLLEAARFFARHLNAILYVTKGGIQWRLLPGNFPPWKTVYHVFRQWTLDLTWEALNANLRGKVRQAAGKEAHPTAAILDSQSVKSDSHGGAVGYDAAKRIKGRKRHLLVDTLGLMLGVAITPASTPERAGAQTLLQRVLQVFAGLRLDVGGWRLQRTGLCPVGPRHPAQPGSGGRQALG